MRKRRPVTETSSPDTVDLRSERARLIQEIRKLEWDFDKHPTVPLAESLCVRRSELSEVEEQIAVVAGAAVVRRLLGETQRVSDESNAAVQNKIVRPRASESGHRANGPPHGTEGVTSMQAQSTVRLYEANRLDRVKEWNPEDLAQGFINAVGTFPATGGGVEWTYRWWITNSDDLNSSFDEADWPAIWAALERRLNTDPALKERTVAWVWG